MSIKDDEPTLEWDIRVIDEALAFRSDVPWPSLQRIIGAARAGVGWKRAALSGHEAVVSLLDATRPAVGSQTEEPS